ncbi:nucleotidyltransferase domain-containing protein [Candidatus Chloroploca sp. Khr17]|nr:nucleotidyltransferase domain-containing protein [Candidatus Chloroploca sp. Khr17]
MLLEALGCFGSAARSEATADSDVDVIELRNGMSARLKERVEKEAAYA